MNDKDREMLVETHTFAKQNYKALHGNGRAGLLERMDKAEGAWKATVTIGGVVSVILGLAITFWK